MQKTGRLYPWRITAVIFSLFFLCPPASFSSWKIAGQLPVPIGCCYFLNANQGLVGSGFYSTPTPIAIYITNDGGSTWTLAGTPPATGQVTQIAIRPDGTGYASIFSRNNPATNLWKTTDGGYSWKDVSSGSHYGTGVGVTSTGVFTAQWSAPVSPGANSNGVFVMDDADVLITNGPNTGTTGEAWGAYGDSSRHIWYIVAELSRQLLISTDRGVTWKPRFNFGAMMSGGNIPTGEIYGFDDALYVQTEVDGIFKGSMSDTGATWHRIGGPSNVADTRTIYASGCAGQNIIAFDRTGTYWKSEDGGDGTGSTASLKIQHINFQSISTCTNATKKATLTNKGCLPFVISNVSLLNNAAGAFTLLPPIKIPDTLAVGATDTFTVTFDARHIAGSYKAQIRVQGYFEAAFGTAQVGVDSNINLAGSATVEAPKVQISVQEIDFGDVSICANARDSIIRITNQGCDSLEFVSGPSGVDSAFILSNTIFPFILPPDSTLVVDVRFKPFIVGPVASYLVYRIATDGGTTDLKFHIEGNGIPGEGILFYPFQSFDFDTISICALDSVAAFMTNIGCGPLYIDHWTASGPFYLTGDGSLAPGVTIQPGDTIFFRFHPGYAHSSLYKGIDSGRFFVNVTGGSVPNDLLITFKGYIGDGSRVLNASLQKINFGTTSLCDQKDTSIILRNTGCDTLTVNDAHISGTGFTISGATFPLIIPPDSIIPIDIFTALDTAGGKLLVEDSLILLSNSDTTFLPIRLSHAYFPHREVGMFLDPTPKAGTGFDVVTFDLMESPGKGFAGANVAKMNFDLAYNTDLLEFLPAKSSSNLKSSDGKTFVITASPEIRADANGLLASLAFQVYLTKDSTTTIKLQNVKLNDLDSNGGPCTLTFSTGSSANFDYRYFCGERSISAFMRDKTITISSIHPNPAHNEIAVELSSLREEPADLEIFNTLGVRVQSRTTKLAKGINSLRLETTDLPNGTYTLRIRTAEGVVSEEFIKVE